MSIPTAEEFFKTEFNNSSCHIDYDTAGLNTIKRSMIEFAKLHVEAALKEASEKAALDYGDYIADGHYGRVIDKDSILNAYPLINIK